MMFEHKVLDVRREAKRLYDASTVGIIGLGVHYFTLDIFLRNDK